MKLLIELYLDEDVDVLLADLVKGHGFSATTARDEGNLNKSDEEQLTFATTVGKAILTHNRDDLAELARDYLITGKTHSGIILAKRRRPYEILQKLLVLLNSTTADEIENQACFV